MNVKAKKTYHIRLLAYMAFALSIPISMIPNMVRHKDLNINWSVTETTLIRRLDDTIILLVSAILVESGLCCGFHSDLRLTALRAKGKHTSKYVQINKATTPDTTERKWDLGILEQIKTNTVSWEGPKDFVICLQTRIIHKLCYGCYCWLWERAQKYGREKRSTSA